MGAAARLTEMAGSGHLAATVLALIGLGAMIVTRRAEERFFGVAAVLIVAAFVTSSTYWSQYNSHLAAAQCALAGFGAAAILGRLKPSRRRRGHDRGGHPVADPCVARSACALAGDAGRRQDHPRAGASRRVRFQL